MIHIIYITIILILIAIIGRLAWQYSRAMHYNRNLFKQCLTWQDLLDKHKIKYKKNG